MVQHCELLNCVTPFKILQLYTSEPASHLSVDSLLQKHDIQITLDLIPTQLLLSQPLVIYNHHNELLQNALFYLRQFKSFERIHQNFDCLVICERNEQSATKTIVHWSSDDIIGHRYYMTWIDKLLFIVILCFLCERTSVINSAIQQIPITLRSLLQQLGLLDFGFKCPWVPSLDEKTVENQSSYTHVINFDVFNFLSANKIIPEINLFITDQKWKHRSHLFYIAAMMNQVMIKLKVSQFRKIPYLRFFLSLDPEQLHRLDTGICNTLALSKESDSTTNTHTNDYNSNNGHFLTLFLQQNGLDCFDYQIKKSMLQNMLLINHYLQTGAVNQYSTYLHSYHARLLIDICRLPQNSQIERYNDCDDAEALIQKANDNKNSNVKFKPYEFVFIYENRFLQIIEHLSDVKTMLAIENICSINRAMRETNDIDVYKFGKIYNYNAYQLQTIFNMIYKMYGIDFEILPFVCADQHHRYQKITYTMVAVPFQILVLWRLQLCDFLLVRQIQQARREEVNLQRDTLFAANIHDLIHMNLTPAVIKSQIEFHNRNFVPSSSFSHVWQLCLKLHNFSYDQNILKQNLDWVEKVAKELVSGSIINPCDGETTLSMLELYHRPLLAKFKQVTAWKNLDQLISTLLLMPFSTLTMRKDFTQDYVAFFKKLNLNNLIKNESISAENVNEIILTQLHNLMQSYNAKQKQTADCDAEWDEIDQTAKDTAIKILQYGLNPTHISRGWPFQMTFMILSVFHVSAGEFERYGYFDHMRYINSFQPLKHSHIKMTFSKSNQAADTKRLWSFTKEQSSRLMARIALVADSLHDNWIWYCKLLYLFTNVLFDSMATLNKFAETLVDSFFSTQYSTRLHSTHSISENNLMLPEYSVSSEIVDQVIMGLILQQEALENPLAANTILSADLPRQQPNQQRHFTRNSISVQNTCPLFTNPSFDSVLKTLNQKYMSYERPIEYAPPSPSSHQTFETSKNKRRRQLQLYDDDTISSDNSEAAQSEDKFDDLAVNPGPYVVDEQWTNKRIQKGRSKKQKQQHHNSVGQTAIRETDECSYNLTSPIYEP